MRDTALFVPGSEPGLSVAFAPVLDVAPQGEGTEEVLAAAREAATLASRGSIADGEEVPVEPSGAVVAALDVPATAELAVA